MPDDHIFLFQLEVVLDVLAVRVEPHKVYIKTSKVRLISHQIAICRDKSSQRSPLQIDTY
jgi:hypothetical protein